MTSRHLAMMMGLAMAIEAANLVGWVWWQRIESLVAVDPNRAAEAMARSLLVQLPAFAELSRQLDGRMVENAGSELAAAAFNRLGVVQGRWMPTDARGPRNRSRAHRLWARPTEALGMARRALQRFPTSPFELRSLAACELEVGDRSTAFEHLADAEAFAGGYRLPPIELSEDESDWVRLEGMRRRLDVYPRRHVTSSVGLARELMKRGAKEAAEDLLRPMADEPEARIELARWDIERGEPESAIERVQTLPSDRGLPAALRGQSLVVLAEARSVAGDEEGALSAAREALRLDPDSAAPYLALARVAEATGDISAALGHLRRAWGVAPDNVSILVSLARVAEAAGKPEDARLALERAVELRPEDPSLCARLAEHHLRAGDLAAAALALSRGKDRFPGDPRLERLAERLQSELERR